LVTLAGLTVLLTRDAKDNHPLGTRIVELGGKVVESPLISISHLPSSDMGRAWAGIEERRAREGLLFRGVVATSANALLAAEGFLRADTQGFFSSCFVVGERTARTAAGMGLLAVHPQGVRNAADLAGYLCSETVFGATAIREPVLEETAISGAPGRRERDVEPKSQNWLLWLRGQMADGAFGQILEAHGWVVDEIICYETILRELSPSAWAEVSAQRRVAIVFYSPSAVRAFVQSQVVRDQPLTNHATFIAIGDTTNAALQETGLRPSITASRPTVDGVLDALKLC
jgi:uroporphyrinogen-III synthase